MGTLFVVATPIGNLEDMTHRAIRVLGDAAVVLAEDTRRTRVLLDHYGVRANLVSYHSFNERAAVQKVLGYLESGDVALVSDAGTPGISDPGRILVEAVASAGYRIEPIPGASALTAAVSASGLIDGPFVGLGFLARKGKERRDQLQGLQQSGYAFVLFESPHRVKETLVELAPRFPGRRMVLFREVTKLHEERIAGTIDEVAQMLAEREVRGEIVIVVGSETPQKMAEDRIEMIIEEISATQQSKSDQARLIAERTGLSRSDAYQRLLDRDSGTMSPETQVSDGGAECSAEPQSQSGRSRERKNPD